LGFHEQKFAVAGEGLGCDVKEQKAREGNNLLTFDSISWSGPCTSWDSSQSITRAKKHVALFWFTLSRLLFIVHE